MFYVINVLLPVVLDVLRSLYHDIGIWNNIDFISHSGDWRMKTGYGRNKIN